MPGVAIPAAVSRKQAIHLAKITPQQLSAWEKHGLAPLIESYTQQDILLLRNLRTLKQSGVPYTRMTALLNSLRQRLGEKINPLGDLRLRRHGKRLAVHWEGRQMEAESGQLLLELEPAELKAIVSFPKSKPREEQQNEARQKEASALFYEALERENQGASSDEVVPMYLQALKLDAKCFGAHLNLGTIYFNQRRMRLAEKHYRRALELHPDYVLAHFNLGSLYDETGDFGSAETCYKETLRLDPKYVDAHYNLALLYQNQGRTMEAARQWKTFLQLDPASEWSSIARRELRRLIDATVVPGSGPRAKRGGSTGEGGPAGNGGPQSVKHLG